MKEPKFKVIRDKAPTLEEAQKFVGGLVEIVYIPDGQLLCNEEGLFQPDPITNIPASMIAERMIVGDVMVLTEKALWT